MKSFLAILVVVIAAGVLVPAIASIRASQARLSSQNCMMQCSLAVHTYHDVAQRLPDAFGPSDAHAGKNVSIWFQLLPYLEARETYVTGKNDAHVAPFTAPADPSSGGNGSISFAANVRLFGHGTLVAHEQPVDVPGVGVVAPRDEPLLAKLTFKQIGDGSTNTIMLTTRYSACNGQTTWYAADIYGRCDLGPLPSPGVGGFMGAGSSVTPPTTTASRTAMYQLIPSGVECVPDGGLFGHSFGAGGMLIALGDSSIRNVSPMISPTTFARALCPNDGNPLGTDWSDDR